MPTLIPSDRLCIAAASLALGIGAACRTAPRDFNTQGIAGSKDEVQIVKVTNPVAGSPSAITKVLPSQEPVDSTSADSLGGELSVGVEANFPVFRCKDVETFKRELPNELAMIACYGGSTFAETKRIAATSRCTAMECPANIDFSTVGRTLRMALVAGSNPPFFALTVSLAPGGGSVSTTCIPFDQMASWGDFLSNAERIIADECRAFLR